MNVLIAMDSFKESLSSLQAGCAVAEGIKRVYPDAKITMIPTADGGEGTVEALVYGTTGRMEQAEVTDLLGRKCLCEYGILPDGTAVIEVAAAAGLQLLSPEERDPLHTTTYGVGELIIAAIEQGCRKFIIGLGGSGTNDGGIGMLQALGFDFLDEDGKQVSYGAAGLSLVSAISVDNALPELADCCFEVACDVNNPLCGDLGCSAIYGPQKGADEALIRQMDRGMEQYAEIVKASLPSSTPDFPGAGAAGGLGFAFRTFLNGKLLRGIDLIMYHCRLRDRMEQADLVITGEGRMDVQSAMGKAPSGIAALAKELQKPVIALCGSFSGGTSICDTSGIDACFSIMRSPCTLPEALKPENAAQNLTETVEQLFRLIRRITL